MISRDYRTWRVTCIPYVSIMLYDIMYKRSNSPHPLTLVILLGKCRKYLVVRKHHFSPVLVSVHFHFQLSFLMLLYLCNVAQ